MQFNKYEDPTPTYVEMLLRAGVTNPDDITSSKNWTEEEQERFKKKYNELLPHAKIALAQEYGETVVKERERQAQVGQYVQDIDKIRGPARSLKSGVEQAAVGVLSTLARPLAPEVADEMVRQDQLKAEAQAIIDPTDKVPDWLQRNFRGATRSVVQMAPMMVVGGAAGAQAMAVQAGIIEGNRAITAAKDAGLKGKEFHDFVGRQAIAEAGIALAFQRMGMGGLESLAAQGFTQAGWRGFVKEGLRAYAHELPEELLTEGYQMFNEKWFGIDKTGLSLDQIGRVAFDTAVETFMAVGATSAASGAVQGTTRQLTRLKGQSEIQRQERTARALSDMNDGLSYAVALEAVQKAARSKEPDVALGRELASTYHTSPMGLAQWLSRNPKKAKALLAEDDPASRGAFERAGLPRSKRRAEVVEDIRELVAKSDETQQEVEGGTKELSLDDRLDRFSEEQEKLRLQRKDRLHVHAPRGSVEFTLHELTVTPVMHFDKAIDIIDAAMKHGRTDIAEAAVDRIRRSAEGVSLEPGVSRDDPRYDEIRADLERNKSQKLEEADRVGRHFDFRLMEQEREVKDGIEARGVEEAGVEQEDLTAEEGVRGPRGEEGGVAAEEVDVEDEGATAEDDDAEGGVRGPREEEVSVGGEEISVEDEGPAAEGREGEPGVRRAREEEEAAAERLTGPKELDRIQTLLNRFDADEDLAPEELQEVARRDEGTLLYNKKGYRRNATRAVHEQLDMEGLKWANDNQGDELGDRMLRTLADAMRSALPDNQLGRHPGDTFMMNADTHEDLDIADEKMYSYLEEHPVEFIDKETGEPVSLIVGVHHGRGSSIEEANLGLIEGKKGAVERGERAARGEAPKGLDRRQQGEDVRIRERERVDDTEEVAAEPAPPLQPVVETETEEEPFPFGANIEGFDDDTRTIASEGGMSAIYQGDVDVTAQQPALNVGEMNRLLKEAGEKEPSIVPRLRDKLGLFFAQGPRRGIKLLHSIFVGPVVRTGVVKEGDVDVVKEQLAGATLEQYPDLTEDDLVIRVESTKESGKKRITVYRKDPDFAAKVLGHEIGHWTDWMPDMTLGRGNILGRLATLHRYLKTTLDNLGEMGLDAKTAGNLRAQARKEAGPSPGKAMRGTKEYQAWQRQVDERYASMMAAEGYITKAQVTNELKELSRWWNPFDETADPDYTKYRFSAKELYADAMSVLLNAPGELQTRAPLFYATFFQMFERKAKVREAYNQIVDEIQSGVSGEALLNDLYQGMGEGDEADRQRLEDGKRNVRLLDTLGTAEVDRFYVLNRLIIREKKKGKKLVDPRNLIDDGKYTGSQVEYYLRVNDEIYKMLRKAGVTEKDKGAYLTLTRALYGEGEQGQKAIPVFGDLAGAESGMTALQERMGERKMEVLEEARQRFRALREEMVLEPLNESGSYDQEFMDFLLENVFYSRNEVVEYMDRRHGGGTGLKMFRRLGTIKKISNAWTATMATDISLMWATNWNRAKMGTAKFLQEHVPDQYQEAEMKWDGKKQVPAEPKDPNLGLVTYLEDGQLKGYWTDHYIARAFEGNNEYISEVASYLRLVSHPARLWFTILRPGFQLYNAFFRDPMRSVVNMPHGTKLAFQIYGQLFSRMKALMKQELTGTADEVSRETAKRGLLITFGRMADPDNDTTQLERYLGQFTKDDRTWRDKVTKPWSAWYSKMLILGNIGETANKQAAYVVLKENQERLGWTDEDIDYAVRHWMGSPSFITGGNMTPITNNILLFSNAQLQGTRSDIQAFKNDPYGVAMRRLAFTIMPKVTAIAFASGIMSALFRALGGDDDDEAVKFSDQMKRIYAGVSEYNLANYHVIPIGLTPQGKSVILRIPQDETGRVLGGAITKLLTGGDVWQGLQDSIRYMGDQGPGINPALTIGLETLQYLTGGNPYDSFRERRAVPDRIREAGGLPSHKAFSKWLWNRYGGSFLYKFTMDNPTEIKTWAEKALQIPTVADTFGRFLVISDYGLVQKAQRATEEARAETTRERLAVEETVRKELKGQKLTKQERVLLKQQPETTERQRERFEIRGGATLGRAMASARSNVEKKAVLLRFIDIEGKKPAVQHEVDEFAKSKIYAASATRPKRSKGTTMKEYQATVARWEADVQEAKELLQGLPIQDPAALFDEYWLKDRKFKRGDKFHRRRHLASKLKLD